MNPIVSAGADLVVLTKNQVMMSYKLAAANDRDLEDHAGVLRELVPVVGAGFVWRTVAREATSFLPFLMYPWVASNGKISATGFTFEHSTMEALLEGAEARKGWVAVGDVHFRPKRVAVVGGAVAALLLGGAMRRRSRRRRA